MSTLINILWHNIRTVYLFNIEQLPLLSLECRNIIKAFFIMKFVLLKLSFSARNLFQRVVNALSFELLEHQFRRVVWTTWTSIKINVNSSATRLVYKYFISSTVSRLWKINISKIIPATNVLPLTFCKVNIPVNSKTDIIMTTKDVCRKRIMALQYVAWPKHT